MYQVQDDYRLDHIIEDEFFIGRFVCGRKQSLAEPSYIEERSVGSMRLWNPILSTHKSPRSCRESPCVCMDYPCSQYPFDRQNRPRARRCRTGRFASLKYPEDSTSCHPRKPT